MNSEVNQQNREEFWELHLQNFSKHKGSIKSYCKSAGVSPSSFQYWLHKKSTKKASSFLPVKVTATTSENPVSMPTSQVMDLYKRIYDFEECIRSYAPEDKIKARVKDQKPLLEEIKELAEVNKEKVPDKSKLGQAFKYYLNEYIYLTRYLEDGLMEPDNGFAERAIRKFAIGRNNWLFSDTPDGAEASSLLYSLVVTAKLNGVNAYKALSKILKEVPLASTLEDFEHLANLILTPEPET